MSLRYRDYIRLQRRQIKEKQHLDLTHFVIVSSGCAGDVEDRLHTLEQERIVVSLVPASLLRTASRLIRDCEFSDIQLFEMGKPFPRGIVDERVLRKCFGQID